MWAAFSSDENVFFNDPIYSLQPAFLCGLMQVFSGMVFRYTAFILVYVITTYSTTSKIHFQYPVILDTFLDLPERAGCLSLMLPWYSGYLWNLTHWFILTSFPFWFMFFLHLHAVAFPQSLIQYLVFACLESDCLSTWVKSDW